MWRDKNVRVLSGGVTVKRNCQSCESCDLLSTSSGTMRNGLGSDEFHGQAGSYAFDVIAGEGAEESRPLARSDVPAIVALFEHADGIALLQFELVIVLRHVRVKCSIPAQQINVLIESRAPTSNIYLHDGFGTRFHHEIARFIVHWASSELGLLLWRIGIIHRIGFWLRLNRVLLTV